MRTLETALHESANALGIRPHQPAVYSTAFYAGAASMASIQVENIGHLFERYAAGHTTAAQPAPPSAANGGGAPSFIDGPFKPPVFNRDCDREDLRVIWNWVNCNVTLDQLAMFKHLLVKMDCAT